LASKIWPFLRRPPGARTSSPVEITAIRGRFDTFTAVRPIAASIPISAGPILVPVFITRAPFLTSSPALPTFWPWSAALNIRVEPAASSLSVYSTMTTESAPAGSGAPVMIRAAWPLPTLARELRPAGTSSITFKVTGDFSPAPLVSIALTA